MITKLNARNAAFLSDLQAIERRIEQAQAQVSSGRRINQVSDDPDQISRLLAARSELSAAEQTSTNLQRVKGEVDAAEQGLQNAVGLLDRITVLGTQGASEFLSDDQRQAIAEETTGLFAQLVGIAGTAIDGRYIFSGDADQTIPYTFDLANTPPNGAYQGADATRQILHPSGARMDIALTAEQIFDDPDPSRGVFAAVDALRTALLANDTAAVGDALARVRTASVHLNNELAFYGSAQNQVADGLDLAANEKLRLKGEISTIEEADLAAAILELNLASTHQQAAVGVHSYLNLPTLFDVLP